MHILVISLLLCGLKSVSGEDRSLLERLGFNAGDRLLIINGDDAGMCHAANVATIECMEQGFMRSATIMVPCPWFLEMAEYARAHPERDFGVHLTHTAEWKRYRWAPLAPRDQVRGLMDPQGYMWGGVAQVYSNATPHEALIEGRAQIKRALGSGIDVTHIDSHMGTLQLNLAYVKSYLQLAVEFDLPVRMASQKTLAGMGYPELRAEFAAKGVIFPDHFIYEELKEEKNDVRKFWRSIVRNLEPGVTELYIHAGLPTEELRAITGSWSIRAQEHEVFARDPEMRNIVADQRIHLISYRPLRDLQRSVRNGAKNR